MRPTLKSRKILAKMMALGTILIFSVGLLAAGDWTIETVDQGGTGLFSSMKIDQKGNVHLAYTSEEERKPLKYAFWDHTIGRWFTMTIAQNASFCTLVLDSKQRPHISYADFGTGKGAKLRYIYWAGGADWKSQAVSPAGDAVVGYYTSLALDAQDKPTFSYYDYEGPSGVGFLLRLRSVVWTGNYWGVQMVDRRAGSGKFNSIALDSSGRPQIAYANVKAETSSLRYATWDGETWKTETLEGETGSTTIFSVALIMDKNNTPHIAYTDVTKKLVKYATRQNGKWRLEVVDAIQREAYPDRHGITLDAEGNPYISYYDAAAGTLKIAHRKDGKWYGELVARDYQGFTSSLAIHDGVLWVAFADESGKSLKVGHRNLVDVPVPPTASPALAKQSK